MTPYAESQLLLADPKDVDRIMADELNALSFDDREALSEEMHGVRSLAPDETPEMIHNALQDLHKEIENRLSLAISSLPSPDQSSRSDSYNNKTNNKNTNDDLSRREYLTELLDASKMLASSSSSSPSSLEDANLPMSAQFSPLVSPTIPTSSESAQFSPLLSPAIPKSSEPLSPTAFQSDEEHSTSSNNIMNKYAYALSDGFRMKFLRAELFDIPKAAARYIICIDFLVDYFGLVALQRPLYLQDLDKDEQKLLRSGRLQLLPSRDRFGRRIIVFLGHVGKGYSHRNRFKVCMYLVFQVASDDVTTQRNGLVALFANIENSAMQYLQLMNHQAESNRFFQAVPVRYSAFHCFLPDEMTVIRGLILNMIGKRTRLITRVHIVSSITETTYKLRCFGIPTEDFPVTSSGSIKTKNLMKWIKFRTALEEAHERGDELSSHQHLPPVAKYQQRQKSGPSSTPFLGIECPQLDTVIFRNGGSAWDRPGNIKFRDIVTKMEPGRELQKTMAEKNAFLDKIISKLISSGLTFLVYDDDKDWYVELKDYGVLRKKVFQAIRDQSARRKRHGTRIVQQRKRRSKGSEPAVAGTHQVNESSTNIFMELDHVNRQKWATL